QRLVKAGRITLLPCGQHGLVPTLPDYRIKGGEALFTGKKKHDKRSALALLHRATEPLHRTSISDSVSDSVSDSDSTRAQAHESNEAWVALGQQLRQHRDH